MSTSAKALALGAGVGVTLLAGGTLGGRAILPAAFAAPAHAQATAASNVTPAPSTAAAAGITLHSVTVELPASDRMFPGDASAEVVNNSCLACHSAGMILNQPPLSKAAWGEEVAKMRTLYKAPVAEEDVPAIVAYLGKLKAGK